MGASDDWPTHMYDNTRVGATPAELSTPLNLHWVYASPAPVKAWAGPREEPFEGTKMEHRVAFDDAIHVAVVGGRLYFGSSVDHQIHCVDAQTGQPIWQHFTEGAIRLAPTISQGKLYVGSDDGIVYCLNAEDGSEIWTHRVGPKDDRLLARSQMISRWPIRTGVLIADGVA